MEGAVVNTAGPRAAASALLAVTLVSVVLIIPAAAPTVQAREGPQLAWIREFGTSGDDGAWRILVHDTGVYVAGSTGGALPGQIHQGSGDAFLRKHDFDGNELWTRQFGTPGHDRAFGISVDATGVYSVGVTNGTLPSETSAGFDDAFVRKYTHGGEEVWTRQFGTPGHDRAAAIAVDATGVYVAGQVEGTLPSETSAGFDDAFVRKYTHGGEEVWTRQFGTEGDDFALGIALDTTGMYVAGWVQGALPGGTRAGFQDAFVRKYTHGGEEVWTRQFAFLSVSVPKAIAVHDTGIYVTGGTHSAILPGRMDAFLCKYDRDGNNVWTLLSDTSVDEHASDAVVDDTGIYVAGWIGFFEETRDAFVSKYDFDGNEVWTHQFGTRPYDSANGISVGAMGVYVAGTTGYASEGSLDAFIAKLVVPRIEAAHTSVDFGEVEVGSSAKANVTIESRGTAPLTVRNVSLASANKNFTIVEDLGTPVVLPPGTSMNVTIAFAPSAKGPVEDVLRVESDDLEASVTEISLRGTGVAAPAPPPGPLWIYIVGGVVVVPATAVVAALLRHRSRIRRYRR